MPGLRSLIALLLCASVLPAADTAKLRTLAGQTVEGELVSISEKEIVLRGKDGPVTTPLTQVIDLELQASTAPSEAKYTDVELSDGSLLHCAQFTVKRDQVEAKLVGGVEVKLPLKAVQYVLTNAQDAKVREEWKAILGKQGKQDIVAIRDAEGNLNAVEGTFATGDDTGKNIEFVPAGGDKRQLGLARITAMSFLRRRDPDAPSAVCKVSDTSRNQLAAVTVTLGEGSFTIKTASGVQVVYPRPLLARVDFSQDKLKYLSDLEPVKVVENSDLGLEEHYRRDKNLDNGPLQLGKETYAKGLAVHAYAELVYDLGGQYKDFKAVLGVDPKVGKDPTDVKVVIEGDGRSLFSDNVRREDKPRPITLDVKNVKQLRIVVRSNDLLDLGAHLNLADAKVTK